jgi:SAM-dependent methyltransferase
MPVFDAAAAARIEKMYAAPEIVEQRARTRAALAVRSGERGIDVGCGPGFLACELAHEVGARGRVVAVDSSADMLAAARARAEREQVADRIDFVASDAVRLDVPPASLDFVAAVQVYLYVADIERALGEAARVLRPGGRVVIVDTDWDSCVWLSGDRERHRRVMHARAHDFADAHLPRRLPRLLRDAGFRVERVEVIPILNLRYDPLSFSGGILWAVRAGAVRHGVSEAEADAWVADMTSRTADGDYFFSVNRFLFLARRA